MTDGRKLPDGIAVDAPLATSTGPTWAFRARTTAPSSAFDLDGENRNHHRSARRHVHAQAAPLDKMNRQALLVRSRRHARDARQPRWFERRDPGRHGWRRSEAGRDARKWCVGIAVDPRAAANSTGRRREPTTPARAASSAPNIEIPQRPRPRRSAATSSPVRRLPEPIDLELDLENRLLYWTDRGDPPRGNTVNRAPIDPTPGAQTPEILLTI